MSSAQQQSPPRGDRALDDARPLSYSLRRSRNLETLAGIEYGSCCWKLRAVVRRHLENDDDDADLGVLLQLELRGLGRVGENIDTLLSGGLAGYRPELQE